MNCLIFFRAIISGNSRAIGNAETLHQLIKVIQRVVDENYNSELAGANVSISPYHYVFSSCASESHPEVAAGLYCMLRVSGEMDDRDDIWNCIFAEISRDLVGVCLPMPSVGEPDPSSASLPGAPTIDEITFYSGVHEERHFFSQFTRTEDKVRDLIVEGATCCPSHYNE